MFKSRSQSRSNARYRSSTPPFLPLSNRRNSNPPYSSPNLNPNMPNSLLSQFTRRGRPRSILISLVLFLIALIFLTGEPGSWLPTMPRAPKNGERDPNYQYEIGGGGPSGVDFHEFEYLEGSMERPEGGGGGGGGFGHLNGQGEEEDWDPYKPKPVGFFQDPLGWIWEKVFGSEEASLSSGNEPIIGEESRITEIDTSSYQTFVPFDPEPSDLPPPSDFFPSISTTQPSPLPPPSSHIPFPISELWTELYPPSLRSILLKTPVLESEKKPLDPGTSFAASWQRPDWWESAIKSGGNHGSIPRVQFDFVKARKERKGRDHRGRGIGWESTEERLLREERREAVKRGFLYAYGAYKDHAWGYDEVKPVTLVNSNPFQGWGATIIDSLETMLIMNLTGEYESARRHVNMVDFRLVNGKDWAFGFRGKPREEGEGWNDDAGEEEQTLEGSQEKEGVQELDPDASYNEDEDDPSETNFKLAEIKPRSETADSSEYEAESEAKVKAKSARFTKRAPVTPHSPGLPSLAPTFNWRRSGRSETSFLPAGRDVRAKVGTFETGIRYLGGLIGAYDLSGDMLMLERGKDMAEVLLRAFDTPSGLPINWFDAGSPDYWYDSGKVSLAEVGSMTLELTRLSQITGDPKYFDRAQRAIDYIEQIVLPRSELKPLVPSFFDSNVRPGMSDKQIGGQYGFGAMADSYYEYLIKQHQLIGGATEQYKNLYAGSIDMAYKTMIAASRVVPGRDLLIFGTMYNKMFKPIVEHLGCFTGGMLGLGARLLNRPADLIAGQAITDTCYWVGASTPAGVQPESVTFFEKGEAGMYQNLTTLIPSKVEGEPDEKVQREYLKGVVPGGKQIVPWYIGRPETAESVFYMYRLTGEKKWQDKGWRMFTSWIDSCMAPGGMSSLRDVRAAQGSLGDNMESFVFAETFKYYYLLQSDPELISLDDYVFTTEAHPFLLRNQRPGKSNFWTPSPSHLEDLNADLGQTARGTDAQLFLRLELIREESRRAEAMAKRPKRPIQNLVPPQAIPVGAAKAVAKKVGLQVPPVPAEAAAKVIS